MTESEQLENNAVQYTLGYKDGFLEAKKQFERQIRSKEAEIRRLTELLENAKRDLRSIQKRQQKEEENKHGN